MITFTIQNYYWDQWKPLQFNLASSFISLQFIRVLLSAFYNYMWPTLWFCSHGIEGTMHAINIHFMCRFISVQGFYSRWCLCRWILGVEAHSSIFLFLLSKGAKLWSKWIAMVRWFVTSCDLEVKIDDVFWTLEFHWIVRFN